MGCGPWDCYEPDRTERLHFHLSLSCIGGGNGQPTPVFLPGESQGRGSVVGCRLWGRTESDTTEVTQQQQRQPSYLQIKDIEDKKENLQDKPGQAPQKAAGRHWPAHSAFAF